MAKKSNKKITIDIILPIYNEEKELKESVKTLHKFLTTNLKEYNWQITIADNASSDKSLLIAKKLSKELLRVSYIHLKKKGRGRAVKKAWTNSKAQIVSYMDIDLSTDLNSFPNLIKSLSESGYDVAIGSRLLPKSRVKQRPLKREILSRGYNILIKLMFGTKFSDAQCGFKAVTKKIVKELLPAVADNAWFFDSELLIIAEKSGYKIYEEPVLWIDNPGSTVRVLKTVYGDLAGLWRLFTKRPWQKINKSE